MTRLGRAGVHAAYIDPHLPGRRVRCRWQALRTFRQHSAGRRGWWSGNGALRRRSADKPMTSCGCAPQTRGSSRRPPCPRCGSAHQVDACGLRRRLGTSHESKCAATPPRCESFRLCVRHTISLTPASLATYLPAVVVCASTITRTKCEPRRRDCSTSKARYCGLHYAATQCTTQQPTIARPHDHTITTSRIMCARVADEAPEPDAQQSLGTGTPDGSAAVVRAVAVRQRPSARHGPRCDQRGNLGLIRKRGFQRPAMEFDAHR